MSLPLVTGYDSDDASDDDQLCRQAAGPSSHPSPLRSNLPALTSKLALPPPSSSSALSARPSSVSSGMMSSLPPPKASLPLLSPSPVRPTVNTANGSASSKRKNQIRIETIANLNREESQNKSGLAGESPPPSSKKLKISTPGGSSVISSHSLFGMLPAPTRNRPPTPPPKKAADGESNGIAQNEVRMTLQGDQGDGNAQNGGTKKGNADFRAMLGLKPVQPTTAPRDQRLAAVLSQDQDKGEAARSPLLEGTTVLSVEAASPTSFSDTAPTTSTTQTTSCPAPDAPQPPMDFFSLPSSSSELSAVPSLTTSSSPTPMEITVYSANRSISSAPSVSESYPGWHQNPDGSWFPVTPEALRALQAHQKTMATTTTFLSPDTASTSMTKEEEVLSKREMKKLLERGVDLSTLQSVDLETTRREWEKRPVKFDVDQYGRPSSSSSTLDAKYAAAAGLAASQREETEEDDAGGAGAGEGRKRGVKTDVKVVRGKGRGQLSNLILQAAERKEELEQKWAEGKSNRATAGSRYGW